MSKPSLRAATLALALLVGCTANNNVDAAKNRRRAIIFVWDGLRPDSINASDTPRLAALAKSGVTFQDNHSTYPTFTMMNAASLATGSFPGTTGFFGNTLYAPGATGNGASGKPVDFSQPAFTEDYAILQDLDAYYQNQLFLVGTLFSAAQAKGLTTAAVGKSGPAYLQDYKGVELNKAGDASKGGFIIDEKMVWPLPLAQQIQADGRPLPDTTPNAYASGALKLDSKNGTPTKFGARVNMTDGVTGDASDSTGSPYTGANAYMMGLYLDYVLPRYPDLTLIWFRVPDSVEHTYGPGSSNYRDGLRQQDALLGTLLDRLAALGRDQYTDVIVVSDHGHSSVAGPSSLFPLRAISAGAVGSVDAANGYSVSGDVRLADLLTRGGFTAYDGNGCTLSPTLSGIKADGTTVYTTQTDSSGSVCGKAGAKYTTASFRVPASVGTNALVLAPNGGSEYIYVPKSDATTPAMIGNLVRFLQSREEVGAIFVAKKYGAIPGTLPMDQVKLENTAGRNPDVILSYNFDAQAQVQGLPGTEFESMQTNRGMHGSFGPSDVHNTLIAAGPDFTAGMTDTLPSGNVDVAPTVAKLLGLSLPQADGRVLNEALVGGAKVSDYAVASNVVASPTATGLTFALPTDPSGAAVDAGKSSYNIGLHTKTLTAAGASWTYFDYAEAVRK